MHVGKMNLHRVFWPSVRRWLGMCGKAVDQMLKDRCFTHAAAIAFFMIFSLFPLLLLSMAVLGFFLERQETQSEVMNLASQYFPPGSIRLIHNNIQAIVKTRDSLSLLSVLGLVWAATLMFDEINQTINIAWGVHIQERYIKSKIKSILIVSFLVLIVLVSTIVTTQLALTQRFASFLLQVTWGEWIWKLGDRVLQRSSWVISWVLTVTAFTLTYRFLPRDTIRIRDVWAAALMSGTLCELSKGAFVWYVTRFANYGQVYGPISAVLLLLLWTFFSALILIWGAEFAAEHTRLRRGGEVVIP